MTAIRKVLRGYRPLQYGPFGIILARGYDLFVSDVSLDNIRYLTTIPVGKLKRFCARNRLLARSTRSELGVTIYLEDERSILLVESNKIFGVDPDTGKVHHEVDIERGSMPLSLQWIDIPGFEKGVYFGEYLTPNNSKDPVRIMMRQGISKWKTVFTFPAGSINHIHNIIPDRENNRVYVLTGDFDGAACIWVATEGFSKVERLLPIGQQSRACWVIPVDGGFIYATDTQFELNHIYKVKEHPSGTISKVLMFPIIGSSIYKSDDTRKGIVFSTAVEPNHTNKLLGLLDRKPADWIIGRSSCIYFGNPELGFTILAIDEKDPLPFRLFQFGSFKFPSGLSPNPDFIHAYGVALKKYDDCTLLLNKKIG